MVFLMVTFDNWDSTSKETLQYPLLNELHGIFLILFTALKESFKVNSLEDRAYNKFVKNFQTEERGIPVVLTICLNLGIILNNLSTTKQNKNFSHNKSF